MSMQPIETRYKGYRFRSRLEARWAVFLDALGVDWQYEVEGFETNGSRYLPDFWLPRQKTWLEIKPEWPADEELAKLQQFSEGLGEEADHWIIAGRPWLGEYEVGQYRYRPVLGIGDAEVLVQCPLCKRLLLESLGWHKNCRRDSTSEYIHCYWCDCTDRNTGSNELAYFHKGDIWAYADGWCIFSDGPMGKAYRAASGARFEHGEHGR